jgi:hypothetical protein
MKFNNDVYYRDGFSICDYVMEYSKKLWVFLESFSRRESSWDCGGEEN